MNILFISLLDFENIDEHGIYTDLLREFVKNGHFIRIISPVERRHGGCTRLIDYENYSILKVRIGNIQKTNYLEKAVSIMLFDRKLLRALRLYCPDEQYDLIMYATPPVTIVNLVRKLKLSKKATTFLLLKDIWPQEMSDLGVLHEKSLLYKMFKKQETQLYSISDWIGCTSPANIRYILNHNSEIQPEKVVQVSNSVDPQDPTQNSDKIKELRAKLKIPIDSILFFFGGNLGKAQDIPFVIECLKTHINRRDCFFLICGQGTEYSKLDNFIKKEQPSNMRLVPYLPKNEYDEIIKAVDVGMIFLDHRFTVPNCPARFYTYMEYAKPVLACTDCVTDIKNDIQEGEFGWWCKSTNVKEVSSLINEACSLSREQLRQMGLRARKYLEEHYTVDKDYHTIMKCVNRKKPEV